jgi:3-oxoacyl-(acyl-carrier-protein) synthase
MSLHTQTVPRIKGLEHPIDAPLNFAKENKRIDLTNIVKNSLVFGGINYSFVFKRYNSEAPAKL